MLPKPLEDYKTQPKNLSGLNLKEEFLNNQNKKFQCTQCPMRFSKSFNIEMHVITHHHEHLACSFCYVAYYLDDYDEFQRHMFKHIGKYIATNFTQIYSTLLKFYSNLLKFVYSSWQRCCQRVRPMWQNGKM